MNANAYADVSVIVDGALEEEERFYDETLMRDYLSGVEEESKGHGYRTEVYVVFHDHEETEECACVQYLTNHKPYAVYNN